MAEEPIPIYFMLTLKIFYDLAKYFLLLRAIKGNPLIPDPCFSVISLILLVSNPIKFCLH